MHAHRTGKQSSGSVHSGNSGGSDDEDDDDGQAASSSTSRIDRQLKALMQKSDSSKVKLLIVIDVMHMLQVHDVLRFYCMLQWHCGVMHSSHLLLLRRLLKLAEQAAVPRASNAKKARAEAALAYDTVMRNAQELTHEQRAQWL
jgi:hypothetical protein